MEQFKQFNVEKRAVVHTLCNLKEILKELAEIGVDVTDNLSKVSDAVKAIESDVLRIALLGAFSDGKTSVIAAWLGRIMDDMKIDMDESSDRLAIYKPEGLPDRCEIVDTPGLFGDKEITIDGAQVMYEDLTKRYISETHLIFYVVDATNPLKESHNDIIKWILRDLNKLSSTIFVINKMDEVTDLTEQAMFDEAAAIKKDTLKDKLKRVANLNDLELDKLNIACIASNPNGRGLEFWFAKPEHYESRSRINALKAMTTKVLKANVPEVLISKTGLDVVREVVREKITEADQQLTLLDSYYNQNREETQRIIEDIKKGRSEVKRLVGELFNELDSIEKHLLARLRPLSIEDIKAYLEDEIGYNGDDIGFKLNLKVKAAIDRYFAQSSAVTNRISMDIERQLNASESFLQSISNGAMKSASGFAKSVSNIPTEVIKGTIFAARDALGNVTGLMIKFKPWEVTKMAGTISKWAGPVGAMISVASDLMDAHKAHEMEQTLQKIKGDIAAMIKSTFKDFYELISDDSKVLEFFAPQLKDFEKIVNEMNAGADSLKENKEKVLQLQQKLNALTVTSVKVV
ncbi:LeoA/HP0731 family dynamin-like GTPase [Methylomonas koyamae]|jgi:hypothetical protein|uniref:GTP-binding protein n=1 Tax=Methylomonas koyamae TaxID=702114 RepID=A0AA91DDD6_9GAMM|nr:LeoA/HP0731 family dynamin-like GTPase [Methylomonas koyamae]OAI26190.1 GTP-binding protein [Methylomonas koyamae]